MNLQDIAIQTIDGTPQTLADHSGKVLLIVNVASKCGFTPQYTGLEELYQRYKDRGFAVLGFPCDQFGNQEPGNEAEIAQFCSLTYDVTFPMFAKVNVNGSSAHPLYQYLTAEAKGLLGSESIKWNFTKFLINQNGEVIKRYSPTTKPEKIGKDIQKLLD